MHTVPPLDDDDGEAAPPVELDEDPAPPPVLVVPPLLLALIAPPLPLPPLAPLPLIEGPTESLPRMSRQRCACSRNSFTSSACGEPGPSARSSSFSK